MRQICNLEKCSILHFSRFVLSILTKNVDFAVKLMLNLSKSSLYNMKTHLDVKFESFAHPKMTSLSLTFV